MHDILDTPVAEIGGWGTILAGLSLQTISSFDIAKINPYITGATAIAGFVFVIYKIINIRVSNRVERLEEEHQIMQNEKLKRELDALKESDSDRPTPE